jgi:uncharacterized repeat protein (TIGR03803 family)
MLRRTQRFVPVVLFASLLFGVPTDAATRGVPPAHALRPSPALSPLLTWHDATSESVLYSFARPGISNPTASLIADASGALYGTAGQGGLGGNLGGACYNTGGCGGVFKLTPKGSGYTQTTLYMFQGGIDGGGPFAELYLDSHGALYGTTAYYGSSTCGLYLGCGTVFKLTPAGSVYRKSTLHIFRGGTDGASPTGGLIADAGGALYGVTQAGGDSSNDGTVFKLVPSGKRYVEKVLHRFLGCSSPSKACDGGNPFAALYMDASGALYGTTTYGGSYHCPLNNLCGTVFRLIPNGTRYQETVLYNFKGGSDGANSQGSLIADSHGALYGATGLGGGANSPSCNFGSVVRGCGTVFKLTPAGKRYSESVLYAFRGGSDAGAPQAGVIADASGALYGTTQLGGSTTGGAGWGTVFKLAPTASGYTESVPFAFVCSPSFCDGQAPRAGLFERNGAFYGTTFQGGSGWGTVFRLTL